VPVFAEQQELDGTPVGQAACRTEAGALTAALDQPIDAIRHEGVGTLVRKYYSGKVELGTGAAPALLKSLPTNSMLP
jgi:hypothetical protein